MVQYNHSIHRCLREQCCHLCAANGRWVTDFNIDDEYKYIIEVECKIWHLIYGLGKRTDIHTAAAAQPEDFCHAFTQMDWATTSINNIAGHLLEEEETD